MSDATTNHYPSAEHRQKVEESVRNLHKELYEQNPDDDINLILMSTDDQIDAMQKTAFMLNTGKHMALTGKGGAKMFRLAYIDTILGYERPAA